jgi:hypothetical protein
MINEQCFNDQRTLNDEQWTRINDQRTIIDEQWTMND